MKAFKLIILPIIAFVLLTCENVVSLGARLDLNGPVVEFTSPSPRKAVTAQFVLEGTAEDYSGVKRMLIRAEQDNIPYPKQWRYDNGRWEVSINGGGSWEALEGARWEGTQKLGIWSINIDLRIPGMELIDGEYIFILQAWDLSGMSDDNSYKTRVLIFDVNPPKVEVINPFLYSRYATYDSDTDTFESSDNLQELHGIDESDKTGENGDKRRFDPTYIGRFTTQSFLLQWQIEDNHDIWSVDIRFYKHDFTIDQNHLTVLDDTNYIYNYHKNLPPPPDKPLQTVNPNGSIQVPALDSANGFYGDGGELKNRIDSKTTIKVVSICYDAAGNPNQEKVLGYFIYWPAANEPWIMYPDGMNALSLYEGKKKDELEIMFNNNQLSMIYPGRSIKPTAYHAHGLGRVVYSLFKYNDQTGAVETSPISAAYENQIIVNPPRASGMPSNIFPWEFIPPPSTGYYVIRAKCYSYSEVESQEYAALFMVQDISFPDFPTPSEEDRFQNLDKVNPAPNASIPLFASIDTSDKSITIRGRVRDATDIKNLTMVWINPESEDFAAMSQLSYFRDKDYKGWKVVIDDPSVAEGQFKEESYMSSGHPNKVWRLKPIHLGEDYASTRQEFEFEQKILLSDLNIAADGEAFGAKKRPLVSQVFLFRAENPDGKTTIITYAPQGDTLPPRIKINNVTITRGGSIAEKDILIPSQYVIIDALENTNVITINGTWEEGSAAYLDPAVFLRPRMNFSINGYSITGISSTGTNIQIGHVNGDVNGTFKVTGILNSGNTLIAESLKDTLVVNANVTDIGGNFSEDGASWLIQSDRLQFLRVTSTNQSNTYTRDDNIEIYFEFNKPVKLLNQGNHRIRLNAQNGSLYAYAVYKSGQLMEDTRQYFEYKVESGYNTPAGTFLNVIALDTAVSWSSNEYPFAWEHTMETGVKENIRVTTVPTHNGDKPGSNNFYAHNLPVSGMYSLVESRNIKVDTAPPAFSSVTATPAGWHTTGAEIYINVKFDKNVKVGTGANAPYLTILGKSTDTSDVRVNNDIVTFKYKVAANDNSNGNPLQITGSGGVITDLVNTQMQGQIGSASSPISLTGVYVDTIAPAAPTVEVRSGGSVISNIVSGNTVQGTSGGAGLTTGTGNQWPIPGSPPTDTVNNLRNLQTIYHNDLSLQITRSGNTNQQDLNKIEYSVNYGTDWQNYSTDGSAGTAIAWGSSAPNGVYQITARQIDEAGNVSNWARPVTFNWDKGDNLVTRIDSFTPNGIYTYNSVRQSDQVEIVLQLRKQINITAAQITLNAVNSSGNAITVTPVSTGNNLDRLTFRYNVANGHTTNNANLTVSAVSITATDSTGVTVTSFASKLPASSLILPGKEIKIQTGGLTVYNNANPSFTGGAFNQTDGTYTATLTLEFARHIYKNSGSITIEQQRGNYKLPAVLTEAQAARFSEITGFSTYYTRGTNGYNFVSANNRSADTTPKYILNYNIDTALATNQPTATGTGGSAVQQMAEAFRVAESVVIPVTAAAVTINNNASTGRGTLNITLTGTNALQVLGANYLITIPAEFVQDELSNTSQAINHNITIGQVSRPFIRVRKTQDTITVNNAPSLSQPRFVAAQPFQASVRMDSRTPSARIFYIAAEAATTTNALNWDHETGPSGQTAAPGQPADPRTTTTNRHEYSAQLSIGTADDYQGLQWYARARATTGNGTINSDENTWSVNSEQMAFKTVVTFVATSIPDGTQTGQNFKAGDQLWIRGGDDMSSSTIPGYPLTWEDNWNSLQNKRAGIRLFTRTSTGTTDLNSSTYKLVTWDITVDTFFDLFLGNDDVSNADTVWQYGPIRSACQRANWTSFKMQCRIMPGQHRWLTNGNPNTGKGTFNFSGTWSPRPVLTASSATHVRLNQADPNLPVN